MKHLMPVLFLVLPAALFAQGPKDAESAMLKKLGLNDSQVAQVLDIHSKTQATVRQDRVQLRLLRAQLDKALLPANPNMQEVNGYIAQMTQTHADLMKAYVSARVQLRQILGDDNFPVFFRFMRRGYDLGYPGGGGMMGGGGSRGMMGSGSEGMMGGGESMMGGAGSMIGGQGSMMGGSGSMMGGSFDDDD